MAHRLRRAPMIECAGLFVLCCLLYLPGLAALAPIDRDEALYAQASRQMLSSGDLTVPRVGERTRLIKPIGIYWLQVGSNRALRLVSSSPPRGMLPYRLPSVLGAIAAVIGTWCIGRRWLAPPAALLGAALLAASALLVVEAHLATTDAALLACTVGAQGCLAALHAGSRRGEGARIRFAVGFWLAQAAGILIKGPVLPFVGAATLAALALTGSAADRAAGRRLIAALRPALGAVVVCVCVLPWLLALGSSIGWRALPSAMAGDIVPKLTGAHESHGAPPGFYLLLAPATFWPGSLLLLPAIVHAWRRRRRPAERFLLCWLVPTWVFFECLPTKLPHYVLPALPALALLSGRAGFGAGARSVFQAVGPRLRLVRWALRGWALIPIVAATAAGVTAWRLAAPPSVIGAAAAGVAIALATGGLGVRSCRDRKIGRALVAAIAGAVSLYACTLELVLPRLDALWLSRRIAAAMTEANAPQAVVAVGYAEPSLMFLLDLPVRVAGAEAAADALAQQPGQTIVAGEFEIESLVVAAQRRGIVLRRRALVEGVDYTHGRWLKVELLVAAEPEPGAARHQDPPRSSAPARS